MRSFLTTQPSYSEPGETAVAEEPKTVEIPLDKIEELLPGYRVLNHDDLSALHRALRTLWKEAKDLPEDFRHKLFAVKEHVLQYLVNKPGPLRPTMAESLANLEKILPDKE